jgi:hypothetical protein
MKKPIKTYEEFFGDLTTDKLKDQALAQAAEDGDVDYYAAGQGGEDNGSGSDDADSSGDEMGS